MGATIVISNKINDKFMLDLFFGGGNQQGFYKGYLLMANVMKLLSGIKAGNGYRTEEEL
jgi:hypothetical protein